MATTLNPISVILLEPIAEEMEQVGDEETTPVKPDTHLEEEEEEEEGETAEQG